MVPGILSVTFPRTNSIYHGTLTGAQGSLRSESLKTHSKNAAKRHSDCLAMRAFHGKTMVPV